MATYLTPGVYVEEIPKFPPSVAPVATAIPAFIGYTEKDDLKLKATRIESLVDFEQLFGGPQLETDITVSINETSAAGGKPATSVVTANLDPAKRSKHVLYYALQLFYANGGNTAYVVSAGKYNAIASGPTLSGLQAALEPVRTADEPTLIVIPEATSLAIGDFKTLTDAALSQCKNLGDRFAIIDAHGKDKPLWDLSTKLKDAIANFRSEGVGTSNLNYGAAYAPYLETVLDYQYDESQIVVAHKVGNAAGTLDAKKLSEVKPLNSQLYERAKAAITGYPLILPPSGAMAGIYAQVDATRGVWKAPANVSVSAVTKPTIEFSNTEQDDMNVDATAGKSVNAIRTFVGKGTLRLGCSHAGRQRQRVAIRQRPAVLHLRRGVDQEGHRAIHVRAERRQHVGQGPGDDRELPHRPMAGGSAAGHQARARLLRRRRTRQDDDGARHSRGPDDRRDRHGGRAAGRVHHPALLPQDGRELTKPRPG